MSAPPPPESVLGHVRRNLSGIVQLVRFEARGLERMDLTARGAWRSFIALPLAMLAVMLAQMISPPGEMPDVFREDVTPSDLVTRFILTSVLSALSWAVVILQVDAAVENPERRGPRLVATHNWATLLIALALLGLTAVGTALGASGAALDAATSVLYLAGLVFIWYAMKTVLGPGNGFLALGLVFLEMVLEQFWLQVIFYPVLR